MVMCGGVKGFWNNLKKIDFKVWEVLKWAILKLQKAQMIINAKGLLARPSNI